MVAVRLGSEFKPILITIETEEEFAKLLGLARHSTIMQTIDFGYFFDRLNQISTQIEATKSNKWYDKLYQNFGIGK